MDRYGKLMDSQEKWLVTVCFPYFLWWQKLTGGCPTWQDGAWNSTFPLFWGSLLVGRMLYFFILQKNFLAGITIVFFVLEMGDLENLIVYSLRRTNIDVENPPFEDHFLWKPYFCSIIFHIYVCLPQKISHHISAHYIPMIPCPVDSARKSLDPASF